MREQEITARVGDLAESVKKKVKIEDDRIELKLQWPDPVDAARRIAAHANASRGDWFLWVIGMKDTTGKIETPSPQPDTSTWWAQVRSKFENGHAPAAQFVGVPIGNEWVTAICFETDLAPFVVENEAFGTGDKVRWEVPWREGTAVRTAGRVDFLRMLVPLTTLPVIDVLSANANVENPRRPGGKTRVTFNACLYLTPADRVPVTIPEHLVTIDPEFRPPGNRTWKLETQEFRIRGTEPIDLKELYFERPGRLAVLATLFVPDDLIVQGAKTRIAVAIGLGIPTNRVRPCTVEVLMQSTGVAPERWVLC
jgi:hypothetical protein